MALMLTVHAATFGFVALAPSTVAQGTYSRGFRSDVVRWSKDGRDISKSALMLTAAQVAAVKAFDGKPDSAGLVSIALPEGKRGRKPKALAEVPAFAKAAQAKAPKARQTRQNGSGQATTGQADK